MLGLESARPGDSTIIYPHMTTPSASTQPAFYPIGSPGRPWGPEEVTRWRATQTRQRSYADDVLRAVGGLRNRQEVETYGEVVYGDERYLLQAVRVGDWRSDRPAVLVTGGVHGYETSGVHGALHFLEHHAQAYADRLRLLVVPCVSPWAYERIHRWNFHAVDPNRAFRHPSPAPEAAALMELVAPLAGEYMAHIDLHETTDTDESEYRPAKAARDGEPFEPGSIPDGFYLVDDAENPQPAFQRAIIDAVAQVTHIAEADLQGELIGSPQVDRGVIRYPLREWGLCGSISGARYTTTTEVYPDSPRTTPQACVHAQVVAVCAALDFVLAQA